jgi:RND family efflux transporter MFP subunit
MLAGACKNNKEASLQEKLNELRKQEIEIQKQIADIEKQLNTDKNTTIGKEKFVGITVLNEQIFKTYIDVQGRIDSDENVTVSSEMPGTITKINVQVGDEVTKGQLLAETDNKAILQGIEEIKTNLEMVKILYEKQKALWEQKIGTEIQYLQAKTQKESLESRLASMNEQLKMTRIVSPINGIVDEINIKLGSAVAPGIPAIRIVNLSKLKVKADLAENYAKQVKKGDNVTVIIPDTKDTVQTQISYASKVINPFNRTFSIEAPLNGSDYHPNMVAKVLITSYTSNKPVVVIPVSCIQTDLDGKYFVVVNKNNKAIYQYIQKGKEYNGQVEVLSGLSKGDSLVTEGYESVNEGDVLVVK